MSRKKLIIGILRGFIFASIVLFTLNLFFDFSTATLIFLAGIFILTIVSTIFGHVQAKQGNQHAEIFPKTNDIPDELKKNDKQLQSLGFMQMGMFTRRYQFTKSSIYTYRNPTGNIIAYQTESNGSHVTFSSYLADGYDISTDYPHGIVVDSEKLIRRIVKSDLDTALDYHTHHVRQQMPEHGVPKKFDTIREILDWEDHHQITVASHKSITKFSGKFYLRILAMFIIITILPFIINPSIYIVFMIFGIVYEDMPNVFNLISFILFWTSFVACGLWAFKPFYKTETVEDRKKKELA